MDFFVGLLKTVVTVACVVLTWWYYPQAINNLMDFNLDVITFMASLLPVAYGAQVEATLRLLAGEKALIFFEAGLAVTIIFKYVFRM